MYEFLKPLQAGSLKLKNRVIYSAMSKYMCKDEETGELTEQFIEYYRTIARGGVALVVTEATAIDSGWPSRLVRMPWIDDDRFIPGIRKLVNVVHGEGALIAIQLWHPGQAIYNPEIIPKRVDELTVDEIHHIQDQYVQAMRRCKEAGADTVEYHMAHNYLPEQFLSPYFNKRTDQYGADTVENAVRFSVEVLEKARQVVGDYPIIAKINGSDFVDGGVTPEWAAEASLLMEKAGIALITVNGGGGQTRTTGMSADGNEPEGWKVPFAAAVKKKVSIPVAANGNIRHPEYADQIIRDGRCDAVAIGRGILAEPQWVKKASEGREDEMRYCVSCMHCFAKEARGISNCSVNPCAKREYLHLEVKKDGAGRKVVVVGAGPAGLEAAVTLAERGFAVSLYDENDRVGGMVNLAAVPIGKQKLYWMIKYYEKQLQRLQVDVHLNEKADAEKIRKCEPYAVYVALGSTEAVPPIPGIDGENVVSVRDILKEKVRFTKKKIVVAGAGLTGLETARMLQMQGNKVTVLEMEKSPKTAGIELILAIQYAKQAGVEVCYEHKIEHIYIDKVVAATESGSKIIPAENVVLSLGVKSERALCRELEEQGIRYRNIGDSNQPGTISNAVQAGFDAAIQLS